MAQTMAKNGKIILLLQHEGYTCHTDIWFQCICGIVSWSVRFHSEIFYAKPKEFIDRQMDRTIHGK